MNATDIVATFTAERLAGRRAAIAQLLATGIAALQQAQALARESALACAEFALILRGENTQCWQVAGPAPAGCAELLAAALRPVDAAGWRQVLAASGVRAFMHGADCETWPQGSGHAAPPPLTAPAIAEALDALHAERSRLFAAGARRIARDLRSEYDHADPAPLPARLELSGVFDVLRGGSNPLLMPNLRRAACLDELERVFAVLDAAPPAPDTDNWPARLNAALRSGASAAHGRYFALRWRSNGRASLLFLRAGSLDRFNAIVAGKPASAGGFARETPAEPFTLEPAV